jgi:hypothetical protein
MRMIKMRRKMNRLHFMMRGVFVVGTMIFRGARSSNLMMLGVPKRRMRVIAFALSVALCLTAVHVPPPSAHAAPVAAPVVVAPAATKAIVETAGALIAYYFLKEKDRDRANGDQWLRSSIHLVNNVLNNKKYSHIFSNISLQITACIARGSENTTARKSNKQYAINPSCANLIGGIVNTILSNKSLTNDIVNHYNKQKNNPNSGWDGTLFIFCVTQVLVGTIPEQCKNSFMVQNATSSPPGGRGGTRSSAGGGGGDNDGNFDRPYTRHERYECNARINQIAVCLPRMNNTINRVKQKIRIKIAELQSGGQNSSDAINKITALNNQIKFLDSLESDLQGLEQELQMLFTNESGRSTTNSAHQKSLHAYLDSLTSSFTLIASIIDIEIEHVFNRSKKSAEDRKVIGKLLEMQKGPLEAIVTLGKQLPTLQQASCIEVFQKQMESLRTFAQDVSKSAKKYMQNKTADNYEALIYNINKALDKGRETMKQYEGARNRCIPKK